MVVGTNVENNGIIIVDISFTSAVAFLDDMGIVVTNIVFGAKIQIDVAQVNTL